MRSPGFEPGLPAISPTGWQADVLDQSRRRPQRSIESDYGCVLRISYQHHSKICLLIVRRVEKDGKADNTRVGADAVQRRYGG